MQGLYRWTVSHPWLVLALSLLVVLLCTAGARDLRSTTDYRAYFGPNNPELRAFEALEHQYEQSETLILAISTSEGDLFTPERLALLRDMTEAGWTMPFAMRSESLANFQHSFARGDDIIVEALLPEGPIDAAAVERARRIALSSEELVDRLISANGRVAALLVTTPLPHKDLEAEVPLVADAVRALFAEYRQRDPGLDFHASGVIMLNDAMAQTTAADLARLFPLAFAVIFIGLALYFRSLWPSVQTFGVIVLTVISAYGIGGWLGITLTAASLASGLIIMTLAVADCVHILVSWRQQLSRGRPANEAMVESLRINAVPVMLTSLTTVIGFLSLNFADSPPFRDLGNIVAGGVAMACLGAMFTLPALAMLLPTPSATEYRQARWTQALATLAIRYRRRLLLVGAIVIGVLIAGVPQNRFGDNYAEYFAESIRFRQDTDFINDKLTGMQALQYILHAEEPGGINDPAFLARIEAFTDWYEAQPETRKVVSIVELHKRLNRTMHGDEEAWYRLPENRTLAAQYLFFYELSLPQGLSLRTLYDAEQQQTRLVVLLDTIDASQLEALNERALAWLHQNQPAGFIGPDGGIGVGLMFAGIAERNFRSMLMGLVVAMLLVSVLIMLLMRSRRIALASLLPNIVPGLMGFGLWGYAVGKVGISLAVVGSMTLGIVVDDTIHFLSKYLRARRELGQPPEQAIHTAFETVGSALLLTTIVLVAGFLVISQSTYQLTAYMGLLSAITIALALLADFLLLPALLLSVDERAENRPLSSPAEPPGALPAADNPSG